MNYEEHEEWLNRAKLRYVLYARKSNTDENRQTHSIKDQIRLCKEYADKLGNVNIVAIIEESASARYANNRPKFTQMLKDVESGKYDGIIAYHPDRLARNMREAGIVMDMLKPAKGAKEAILKDLLFQECAFHNDSSGAMMLAIHFAMATQYSDHLQEVVSRGVKSHFKEGKSSGAHKWGYHRDTQGHYVPNTTNTGSEDKFNTVQKAFKMILDGKSEADVVRYLEDEDVHYTTKPKEKTTPKTYRLASSTSVSRMLHDPFYSGILQQAGEEVDLTKLNDPSYEFQPMVSREEWTKIQKILRDNYNNSHRKKTTRKHKMCFYPFRGLIKCKSCGHLLCPFTSQGHNKNSNRRWVYYGCQNPKCPKKTKKLGSRNIRGKEIVKQLANLADGLALSENAYAAYSAAIDTYMRTELTELKKQRTSLVNTKIKAEKRLESENTVLKALSLNSDTPKSTIDDTIASIKAEEQRIHSLDTDIAEIDTKLKDPAKIKQTEQEFLDLLQTAANHLKYGSFAEKDVAARKLFSNLALDEKNSLSISVKPEFEGLILPKIGNMVE